VTRDGMRQCLIGHGVSDVGAEWEVVVVGREAIADRVIQLILRRPDGEDFPSWMPGAHIDVILQPNLVRQFSLCGEPADRSLLKIAVLLEENGRGSGYVHHLLSYGEQVRIRGPRNDFELVEADAYIFIAGGIGISPIFSMVSAVEKRGLPWRLIYGGRNRNSMAFQEDLVRRFAEHVTICPEDETGPLDLDSFLGTPNPGTAVYCCGPESLLLAVTESCSKWPRGALHVERFAARSGVGFGPRSNLASEDPRLGRPQNRYDRCV
jgi:ferredoxin-NADP reductase